MVFRDYLGKARFLEELVAWAHAHPGRHNFYKTLSAMRDERPLSRYERAVLAQVCSYFEEKWITIEDESYQLTIAQRATLALAHVKVVKEPRKEIRSLILLLMGMSMESLDAGVNVNVDAGVNVIVDADADT